jgi:hypothetical protein
MQDTLEPQAADYATSDSSNDPVVKHALNFVSEVITDKLKRDNKDELLYDVYERGFDCNPDRSPEFFTSKKYFQVLIKIMEIMRALDYQIHGSQRPQYEEYIVQTTVDQILQRGGFYSSLFGLASGKGAMQDAAMIGNGYVLIQATEEGNPNPVEFTHIPGNNVFISSSATSLFGGSKPAQKVGVVMSYSVAKFNKLFPKFKGKVPAGPVPRSQGDLKDLDQTYTQEISDEEQKKIEVLYMTDLDNLIYTAVAGPSCVKLIEKKGDDKEKGYPFFMDDPETGKKTYFHPLLHFGGLPSLKGFYRHGFFELFFDLFEQGKRLYNKLYKHTSFEADAISVFNIGGIKPGELFGQIEAAQEMADTPGKPVVALNADAGEKVSMQTISNPINIAEIQFWDQWFDREVKRCGVPMDELLNPNIKATQVLAEIENSTTTVKQMLEYNSEMFKQAVNITMAIIKQTVKKTDKTPIYSTTKIKVKKGEMMDLVGFKIASDVRKKAEEVGEADEGVIRTGIMMGLEQSPRFQELKADPEGEEDFDFERINLGYVAEVLRKHTYFTKVNARSGANVPRLLDARSRELLPLAAPGSKAQLKMLSDRARIYDYDFEGEDFMPPAAGGQSVSEVPEMAPGPTEAVRPNPRTASPQPLI